MSEYRLGRFTSSQIHVLIKEVKGGFSAPALTYIEEKNLEYRLGRSLSTSVYSKPIYWGYAMEKIVFELMPSEYELVAGTNEEHKQYPLFWAGCSDMVIEDYLISEIKSYGLKKFAQYTDMLMKQNIDLFRSEFPQEYWQIVSNSILYNVKYGEAISFMPYKSQIDEIRHKIEHTDFMDAYGFEPWQLRFILEDNLYQLNWIPDNGYYKNVTVFRFEVPEEDKKLLTSKVELAMRHLDKYKKLPI